ncbi:MAG: hypothetical protein M3Y71_07640 [Actinomycetota bacterium]|nr:hypothetical protein [Actinomycetota bacterium]
MTTTTSRVTRTDRSFVITGNQSTAFLAEVRLQWVLATSQYDDALANGDDAGQAEAGARLDELRELLWRHDLSVDILRLGSPL